MIEKPKARRKRNGYAASSLALWWRRAVKLRDRYTCAVARSGDWLDKPWTHCKGQMEAHHIIRRAKGVLSYDLKNGMTLCTYHHAWADTGEGRRWVHAHADMEYLRARDVVLKDYLTENGLSLAEFRKQRADELKEVIRRSEGN